MSLAIAVAATSDEGREITPVDVGKALERLRAIKPAPFAPDRLLVLGRIEKFTANHPNSSIVWIADGIELGHAREFAAKLAALPAHIAIVTGADPVRALAGPENQAGGLEARVLRSEPGGPERGLVRALDLKGFAIGSAAFDFAAANETKARFEMPVELRNEVARLEIADERSAGAVSLLDERWRAAALASSAAKRPMCRSRFSRRITIS